MSARDEPRDVDLERRLDELEDVLAELRSDLKRSDRADRGPWTPPQPPRISELLRFTEQYTIPTLIAVLETTIRSLELLRGTLRLVDPDRGIGRPADGSTDRFADVRNEASAGLARSLSELRTVLAGTELPTDATSRDLITDARDLTAEIESRLTETRADADAARTSDDDTDTIRDRQKGNSHASKAVQIDVHDPDDPDPLVDGSREDNSTNADPSANTVTDTGPDIDGAPKDSAADSAPTVDVDAELASIKRQLDALDTESETNHLNRDGEVDDDDGDDEDDSDAVSDDDEVDGTDTDGTDEEAAAGDRSGGESSS